MSHELPHVKHPELPDVTRTATRDAAATEAPGSPELQGRSPARLGRGSSVDRYVILDRIGEGGMGEVYRAFDPDLNRPVAIKLLRARERRAGAAEQRRLLREARAIARLSHPNVVHVYDMGDAGDEVFIAMELVEGTTLREWMKERRPVDEVLGVFEQAAAGLAAAHRAGIVHRDFKPANVLLGKDGRVRVVDFGLARGIVAVDDNDTRESLPGAAAAPASAADSVPRTPIDGTLTVAGAAVGTPGYMAPEQERGGPVDVRADVYSFCVALCEALEGVRPTPAASPNEGPDGVPSPQRRPRGRRTPPWLQRLLSRGLSGAPAERPASMVELEASLRRGRRRRQRQLLGAGAGACILAVTAYWAGARLNAAEANASVCEAGPARMDQVWGPVRAARLEQAFEEAAPHGFGASTWRIVATRLEASTEAWRQMRRDACEATRIRGEQSEQLMDLRVACLERRLLEVDAVLTLFGHADHSLITEAPRMAMELEDLSHCADAAGLLAPTPRPSDPGVRERIASVERRLAAARALLSAGQYQEARAQTAALVEQAAAIGYPRLIGEVGLSHGRALERTGAHRAALEHLLESCTAADRAGDDSLRASLLLHAAYIASEHLHDIAQTEQLIARAEAVVERTGSPPHDSAFLLNSKRALLQRRGDYAAALQLATQAVTAARKADDPLLLQNALVYHGEVLNVLNRSREALPILEEAAAEARRLWGERHPSTGSVLHALANAYSGIGDYSRTAKVIRENVRIREASFGPDHPQTAQAYHNLSNALRRLGERDEALMAAKRALDIRTMHFRPDHPMVGFSHRVVGISYHALGQHELALAHVQRAAETSRAISDTHPFLARDHFWLGQIALAMGRLEDAERHFREVMRIDRARLGPEEGDQASHHTALAAVDLARGEPRAVLRHVDRAEALAEADENDTQGEASFLRAQALWLLGQHPEARATAERAIELYQGTPSGEPEEVEKIRSWLAERAPPAAARQP